MAFLFSRLIRNLVLIAVVFSAVQYCLRHKSYTFSPKEFRSLTSKTMGGNGASNVNALITDLKRKYSFHIRPNPQWLPITAGGMNMKVNFLHTSLTEYVAVFSAPMRTSGRTGLHWANSTCTVLNGALHRFADTANIGNKETFKPGDNFRFGQFESAVLEMEEDSYVVCYGRGFMPVSAFWITAGAVTQCDPIALTRLVYVYGEGSLQEMGLWITSTFNYYKSRAVKSEL